MEIPDNLRSFTQQAIIIAINDAIITFKNKKKNFNVRDSKSVFGRAVEKLVNKSSTYEERMYIHSIWNSGVKENQPPQIIERQLQQTEKHLRRKKSLSLSKEVEAAILQANCSLAIHKVNRKKNTGFSLNMNNDIENPNGKVQGKRIPNLLPQQHSIIHERPTEAKRKDSSPEKIGLLKRLKHTFKKRKLKPPINKQAQEYDSLPSIHSNCDNENHAQLPPSESSHGQIEKSPVIVEDESLCSLIDKYNHKIHVFPSFLCPICQRIMYENYNTIRKYTFTSSMIANLRSNGFDNYSTAQQITICKRCYDIFNRNKIPSMSFFNKMEIDQSPECISSLTEVEAKLISQIRPFMKIFHLSKGQGQFALKGSCVHFPQCVEEIVETLPINRNAADLLIINETNQRSVNQQQFRVRGKALYEALHFLKINNRLYSEVTIEIIPDEELQINEILLNPNVQNPNIIDNACQPASGYKPTSAYTEILRATICQASNIFNGGNQSIAMVFSAIAHSSIQFIGTWSSTDLYNTLVTGNQYFDKISPNRTNIAINQISRNITCFENIFIRINIIEAKISGYLNKVPGGQLFRLTTWIDEFLQSDNQYAILNVNDFNLCFIKSNTHLFLFDSFSRGPKGRRAENGTACVIKCNIDESAVFFSQLIHRNCQPNYAFTKNLAVEDKQKFQFTINYAIPVRNNENLQSQVGQVPGTPLGILHGFIPIDDGKDILRASFHQGTIAIFPNGGGNQCAAMSASAAAHAVIVPIDNWSTEFLDNILLHGDQFYSSILPSRNRYLEAIELNGTINCTDNINVLCRVSLNQIWHGSLDLVPGDLTRLSTSIQDFLLSDYNNAILTANVFCIALMKQGNNLYLFDSHSRGPNGENSADGLSCVIRYHSENQHQHAADLLNQLCAPAQPYRPNMTHLEEQFYTYSLRPIVCSIQNANVQQNQEDNFQVPVHNDAQRVINNSVHQENLDPMEPKLDIPTHQNPLMLDCVVRVDEPDEPTLNKFLQSCKANVEAIPEVHIRRQQGRPLYPGIERRLEELAFIKALPFGEYGCNEERQIQITPLDYFQQRIMGVNKNFHTTEYLFYALNRVEAHTIQQKIAVCGNMVSNNGAVDNEQGINLPGLENIHLYMGAIRGSGSYWKKFRGDVLGMIEQVGIPAYFLTISYDDLNSVHSLTALWKAKYGINAELPCSPSNIPYEERKQLLNDYPVAAARHFNNRMNIILEILKKDGEEIFGRKIIDYTYRVEFQGRGSPHVHMLLWAENQPDWNTPEGIEILERNISCSLDVPYKDLVIRYQNHSHRSTCFKKHNICRFGFPRKPSSTTNILDEEEIAKSHGRFVEIKRTKDEIMVNNYHPKLIQILKCNMDIQAVTGTRAIAFYIGKYLSKGEPTYLRQEIRDIINNFKADCRASYHRKAQKIASAIIKHREISAQEAAFRLLHLRLRNSSRGFVFVPTYLPQNRVRLIRRDTIFADAPKTGLNIIDRYMLRPDILEPLCLLEFAAWWTPRANKTREDLDKDLNDGDVDSEDETFESNVLKLKDKKGFICKRKRHAIVRSPYFKPLEQTDEYLYSMILLHKPLRNEDFLSGYESVANAFDALKTSFRTHEDDSIINPEQVDKITAILQQLEDNPPDLDDNPNSNEEILNIFELEDDEPLQENEIFVPPDPNGIPLRERVRLLTAEQRSVYDKVRHQIIHGGQERMRHIVCGPGGTGKSFLIEVLTDLITTMCPGGPRSLIKAAPTGVAARNINGVTLHKAFSLGVEQHSIAQYMKLGGRLLHERRMMFKDVLWILLDEYSMISYETFRQIHLRLTEIFGDNSPFGNMNIIIFGDILQLAPVRGHWIFDQPIYLKAELDLWKIFDCTELKTVMRQRNADQFLGILQRLRIGTVMRDDVQKLKERLLNPLAENYQEMLTRSRDSLHLYPKVKQVDEYNMARLEEMRNSGERVYKLTAYDTYGSGLKFGSKIPVECIFQDIRKCAGIATELYLAVGCRVMLKWNTDPLGGLCNGSTGTLKKFIWTALRREQHEDGDLPESVLVQFDDEVATKHLSKLIGFEMCAAVKTKTFEFNGKRGIRVHRRQIPLSLSFSCTTHKAQGLSLNSCTLYIGKHIFKQGQVYVALSRCRTFEGLYITEIDEKKLLVNKKGIGPAATKPHREMMRLSLVSFLEVGDELDENLLNNLITWCLEYVMCKNCKEWVCICVCSNPTKK